MNISDLSYEFGTAMLPIFARAALDKKIGPATLKRFLTVAGRQLQTDIEAVRRRREGLTRHSWRRQHWLQAQRYFDIAQRSLKAQRMALEAVEKHLEGGDIQLLDEAIRQYELGERYYTARVRMRADLTPSVNEKIASVA